MNPFLTLQLSTLNPLHGAITLLLFHADMTMVIRFDLITAIATIELVLHQKVLIIFQFMTTHLAFKTKLTYMFVIYFQ
jgi:hypothetical protein